jgi:hypothetical protein
MKVDISKVGATLKGVQSWIIILIILVVLYFVAKWSGLLKSKEQREKEDQEEKAKESLKQEATKRPLSYPLFNYEAYANAIYDSIKYAAVSDNYDNAVKNLMYMKNDSDFAQLFLSYGKRKRYNFGIPVTSEEDLVSSLQKELSRKNLDKVNSNYAAKGMKTRL